MQMSPVIAVHMTAALLAIATGPVALWARKGATQRPKLHRAFGYAWVSLMLVAATSAIFIRDYRLPNIAGYTPIHVLIPVVYFSLLGSFRALAQGNIVRHKKIMQGLYVGACLVAGGFTLLPGRYLGDLLWQSMPGHILAGTPVWVWGLLAVLVLAGLSQTRQRSAGLARVALMPLGMAGFSLYGAVSAFGASTTVLVAWLFACELAAVLVLLAKTNTEARNQARYDTDRRQFELPGSWVPMALILGIFLIKYAVGVSLNMAPALKTNPDFTLAVVLLSGLFSGIFAGRTLRLLALTRPKGKTSSSSQAIFNT